MSLSAKCRGIVPARFLAIVAHFTMLVFVTSQRKDHIDACLPFDFTQEEYEEQEWRLTVGSYASLTLLAFELVLFLSGMSMFLPSAAIISTGGHLSGAVALSFFFFDRWDCDLFWWVFGWCSALPAIVELMNIIGVAILKIILPDRFKGTVVEKWARYWEGLMRDYGDVARDCITDIQQRPLRAAFLATLAGATSTAVHYNPNETDYRCRIIDARDEMGLVGLQIRNSSAYLYMNGLEALLNEKRIRRLSLGILSLYWVADWSDDLGHIKAQCSYLKPKWLTWHERVIEVGFCNRFWALERTLKDFDVNPQEWESREIAS